MTSIDEALVLTLPQHLEIVHTAILRINAWCKLQGVPPETISHLELPLAEAINNAIEHGCAGISNAEVRVAIRIKPSEIIAEVTDPGSFTPSPSWSELPEDPLSEGGRGGFLIKTNTNHYTHKTTPEGHTLTLHWTTWISAGHGLIHAAEADQTVDQLTRELANSFETLMGLTHFTGLLATTATFAQLLEKVQERLRTMVIHEALVIRFIEGETLSLYPVGNLENIPTKLALNSKTAESTCALERRPFVGIATDLHSDDPLTRIADKICLLVIEFSGQKIGTLTITRPKSKPPFTGGEVELLQAVADFIGIARATDNLWQERNRRLRLEQEIQVAADIQRSLLPGSFPADTRWWIHGDCRPAREVGGDYFDVVRRADGSILVLIADVMGKGVPASLFAAMLRSSLRALAAVEASPEIILTGINRQLYPDLVELGMFITALLVHLPSTSQESPCFANAGHSAPAVLRADGSIFEAPGGSVPLGVLTDTVYQLYPCPITSGEYLFLYTDGCYELTASDGEMLGATRYLQFAAAQRGLAPTRFIERLLDPALLAISPDSISDDRTLVVATLRS